MIYFMVRWVPTLVFRLRSPYGTRLSESGNAEYASPSKTE